MILSQAAKVLGRGHPEADKELNGTFVCKYGLDASTNTYFDFDLDEHVEMAMSQDIFDATSWDLDIDSFTARECHSPVNRQAPPSSRTHSPRPTCSNEAATTQNAHATFEQEETRLALSQYPISITRGG